MKVLALTEDSDRPEANLICELARAAGVEIFAVCNPNGRYLDLIEASVAELRTVEIRSKLDYLAVPKVRKIVRAWQPDIIHSFTARALSVALLGSWGLAGSHITYRGTCGHVSRYDPSSWLTYLNRRITRIVCVSNAVRQSLAQAGVTPAKLVTISKGHRLEWYQGQGRAQSRSEAFGIADGGLTDREATVIGCLANARPVKGVDVLVEAFVRLSQHHPKLHLVLIGELRDQKILQLIASAKARDRIHSLGYRTDAAELLKYLDIFVMPSRAREGLPKALIEAMASSVPIIASAVGGIPELVIHDQSGLLVPGGDVEKLAEALTTLIANQEMRQRFRQAGRERIATEFSFERYLAKTLSLYEEVSNPR